MTRVPSEDFVDKGLVSDPAPASILAELFEDSGIDADRDQLARLVAERRPADRGESQRACVMLTGNSAMLKLLNRDGNGALRRP